MVKNQSGSKTARPKCQNRKGMKCIPYDGKNVYYRNINQLAQKLTLSKAQAKKLVDESSRRIVTGPNNEPMIIDIKKDNFRGLLKRNFGIKRVSNKNVVDESYLPTKGVIITDNVAPNLPNQKVRIAVTIYVSFNSPEFIDPEKVVKNNPSERRIEKMKQLKHIPKKYLNRKKLERLVDKGIVFERIDSDEFSGMPKDIPEFARQIALNYADKMRFARLLHYDFEVLDHFRDKKFKFKKGYLRDFQDVYKLDNWANIVYNESDENCAIDFISSKYPKTYWPLKKKETENGIRLMDCISILNDHKIGYKIYDEQGKLKYEDNLGDTKNIPRKPFSNEKGGNGYLSCTVFNNHVYPLTGGGPRLKAAKIKEVKFIDDIEEKFEYFMTKKKILPSKIKIYDSISKVPDKKTDAIVKSFNVSGKMYVENPEYERVSEILNNMGYSDHLTPHMRVKDIPSLLIKMIRPPNAKSFFPSISEFKIPPLIWKTSQEIRIKKVNTIDKNKCYLCMLYNLPYLIKFDFRSDKINDMPDKINKPYWLYLARPKEWSTLMPGTYLYPGYHLEKCQSIGLEFELFEELETHTVNNFYRQIIDKMSSHMTPSEFKQFGNIMIGSFEKEFGLSYKTKYKGIYNDETADSKDGFCRKIGNHNLFYDTFRIGHNVSSMLPIAIQIKLAARMAVVDKINELQIDDRNIVQIKTDSISYYGQKSNDLDPKNFFGWKEEEYKEGGDPADVFDEDKTVLHALNINNQTRKLHMKYAGAGKTTYIINKLVPKLLKKGISFIVLTPTHPTLAEYRREDINCEIMQKYVFAGTIPEEDFIIIDEIGFVGSGCHELLFKINAAGKSFECFGDFNQLPPPTESAIYNQPHYLDWLFSEIDTKFTNHRNDFTKEYYNQLINNELELVDEVNNHSTEKYYQAEQILCYRHETQYKYNIKMAHRLGFDIYKANPDKKPYLALFQKGMQIICNTNNLLKDGIYNKQRFTVHSDKGAFIELCDIDTGELFMVAGSRLFYKMDFTKNWFVPAYACNIHQVQGRTLNSYYWCDEDNAFLQTKGAGNLAYTVISRLKTK